jgi:hypothetical protein
MSVCPRVVALCPRFDTANHRHIHYVLDTDREEGWELEKIIREGAELKKKSVINSYIWG